MFKLKYNVDGEKGFEAEHLSNDGLEYFWDVHEKEDWRRNHWDSLLSVMDFHLDPVLDADRKQSYRKHIAN
jgi:hypothetical protein